MLLLTFRTRVEDGIFKSVLQTQDVVSFLLASAAGW